MRCCCCLLGGTLLGLGITGAFFYGLLMYGPDNVLGEGFA